MAKPAPKRLSYVEYLRLERKQERRYEYLDGDAWAMAGGSPRHSAIKSNLMVLLGNALRGRPCRAFDSDLKVRVLDTGLATYPDLTVICGALELHPEDPNAATNPAMLVEVVSKETEAWDRGGKFAHYRRIRSLQHYLIVSQDIERIEHYTQQDGGAWRLTEHAPGESIAIAALGIEIPSRPIYEDLPPLGSGE
jgi:Uma2 family endonuclease